MRKSDQFFKDKIIPMSWTWIRKQKKKFKSPFGTALIWKTDEECIKWFYENQHNNPKQHKQIECKLFKMIRHDSVVLCAGK
jgi:hypothetical protein